jgi:hypothetical protein
MLNNELLRLSDDKLMIDDYPLTSCYECNRELSINNDGFPKHKKNLIFEIDNNLNVFKLTNPFLNHDTKTFSKSLDYFEPEDHLDDVCELISTLIPIEEISSVLPISKKDFSLAARIANSNNAVIAPYLRDKNTHKDYCDLSISEIMQSISDGSIYETIGNIKFDLILVRHSLEHHTDIENILKNLTKILKKTGHIYIEVPNCEKGFKHSDLTMLWEEHIWYFTYATFLSAIDLLGYEVVWTKNYEYSLEDCISVLIKPRSKNVEKFSQRPLSANNQSNDYNLIGFRKKWEDLRLYHSALIENNNKILVVGAGHAAATYLHLMQLPNSAYDIADDNPDKMGRLLPGSTKEIIAFKKEKLQIHQYQAVLLATNPLHNSSIVGYLESVGVTRSKIFSVYPNNCISINP